ncbi:Uncharacterized conserved protein, DUF983 family [Arboricoccus pini]|uniref:Uncharacterized conserved protein, DUF983 family n=1 Tax=Arboricoccus pini TaxID=1963835 RepID=A0A212QZI5_9PROT|nr:DUF983 domain-containing protein [Arboricoccus pini]SNB65106.1 Uncharacterized conserved protein, DUF983 family [Arboricoccus pini]
MSSDNGTKVPLSATAFLGRCPACGCGNIFKHFIVVRERCEPCGQIMGGHDSGDGPVAFIVLIAGFAVLIPALIVEVKYSWPIWLHMLVWLPLAAFLSIGLIRPFKGFLLALQYRYRRHEFDSRS